MEKIILTKDQYRRLEEIQRMVSVKKIENLQATTAENLISAKYLLEEISRRIDRILAAIDEFETAVFDHDPEEMIRQITRCVQLNGEWKRDAETAEDFLAGSVARFLEATTPSDFTVIVPEEEIRRVINENFDTETLMSVGWREGWFALIFGPDEETIDRPPFVFAKGREACYNEARAFIETFLHQEE